MMEKVLEHGPHSIRSLEVLPDRLVSGDTLTFRKWTSASNSKQQYLCITRINGAVVADALVDSEDEAVIEQAFDFFKQVVTVRLGIFN